MVTKAVTGREISRFHGMVVLLRAHPEQPVVAVQSAGGEWRADVRVQDGEVIRGRLDSLDRMSVQEWLRLHRDEVEAAWNRYRRGETPPRIEDLPEDWPIGGDPPARALSVKPLEGYRIWVEWEGGSAAELDLSFLADHPTFARWRDRRTFESVRTDGSCFTWGEDMEICAWLECWPDRREPLETMDGGTVR